MVNTAYRKFRADDRSYFSLIKKDIHQQAVEAGFVETRVGEIDIIVSEMTSNLGKYAHDGQILSGKGSDSLGDYLEILSLDQGPGIPDISRVLADGYSSVGSMGQGLGSIKRLADRFDIYSLKDWGTILMVRVYKEQPPQFKRKGLDCQGINIPKTGEQVSGDGSCLIRNSNGFRILIADGLGHGPEAHEAVVRACDAFAGCTDPSPTEMIRHIHSQIRKTRGMVGLVVVYDQNSRVWKISGVGNISARWIGPQNTRNYVGYNGIIGYNIPGSINDQVLPYEVYQQFIACSDGVKSRWDLGKFPTIWQHDGMVIATALYKEFSRGTDDTSVIVCKLV